MSSTVRISGGLATRPAAEAGDGRRTRTRYSVVSAVYNVAPYLDAFLQSIASQTLDFEQNIEVIAVDDGSTDESAEIVARWQARYPDNIRLIRKDNGGPGSARNAGLRFAAGDWITFTDPDDFVDDGYFAAVDSALAALSKRPMALLSCKVVHYLESERAKADDHPLRGRFLDGVRSATIDGLGRAIQNSVHATFFRAELLDAAGLQFDERVRPGFEDGHFLGRYLVKHRHLEIGYAPSAIYFYRKRSDATSLTALAGSDTRHYVDQVEHGYLALLRETETAGAVPEFIQNMVLYSLSWQTKRVLARTVAAPAFLSASVQARYRELMVEVAARLDDNVVARFDLASVPFMLAVGIMNLFKGRDVPFQVLVPAGFDKTGSVARLVFWSRNPQATAAFQIDGIDVRPVGRKTAPVRFLDSVFAYEHACLLALPARGGLKAEVGGKTTFVDIRGQRHACPIRIEALPGRRVAAKANPIPAHALSVPPGRMR